MKLQKVDWVSSLVPFEGLPYLLPFYVTYYLHLLVFPNVTTLFFLMRPHLWPPSLLAITSPFHFALLSISQGKAACLPEGLLLPDLSQWRGAPISHQPRTHMNYFLVISFWKECQNCLGYTFQAERRKRNVSSWDCASFSGNCRGPRGQWHQLESWTSGRLTSDRWLA